MPEHPVSGDGMVEIDAHVPVPGPGRHWVLVGGGGGLWNDDSVMTAVMAAGSGGAVVEAVVIVGVMMMRVGVNVGMGARRRVMPVVGMGGREGETTGLRVDVGVVAAGVIVTERADLGEPEGQQKCPEQGKHKSPGSHSLFS